MKNAHIVMLGLLGIIVGLLFTSCTHKSPTHTVKRRALLIGIQEYADKGFHKLNGSLNDVSAISNALCTNWEFSPQEIKVITNQEATKAAIEKAFFSFLINETKEGDIVVFFFSGHGSNVPDYNEDEADQRDEAILPYDAVKNGGYNILIDDELGLWFAKLHGRSVTVIADCCHSGGALRDMVVRSVTIENYQPSPLAKALSKGGDIPSAVVFMSASREDERALEIECDKGHHGLFTFGLNTALLTLQEVSYSRLFTHACKIIKKECLKQKMPISQEPQILAPEHLKEALAFKQFPLPRTSTALQYAQEHPSPGGGHLFVGLGDKMGAGEKEMIREFLSQLPYIRITEGRQLFDWQILGEKHNHLYHMSLTNGLGDEKPVPPCKNLQETFPHLEKHLRYSYLIKQLAVLENPTPPFMVSLAVHEKTNKRISFKVTSEQDCYIILINITSEGQINCIFPNPFCTENFIKAGQTVYIPGPSTCEGGFEFDYTPYGEEIVKLIATTESLDLDHFKISEDFEESQGKGQTLDFPKKIAKALTLGGLKWSEDMVVISPNWKE